MIQNPPKHLPKPPKTLQVSGAEFFRKTLQTPPKPPNHPGHFQPNSSETKHNPVTLRYIPSFRPGLFGETSRPRRTNRRRGTTTPRRSAWWTSRRRTSRTAVAVKRPRVGWVGRVFAVGGPGGLRGGLVRRDHVSSCISSKEHCEDGSKV